MFISRHKIFKTGAVLIHLFLLWLAISSSVWLNLKLQWNWCCSNSHKYYNKWDIHLSQLSHRTLLQSGQNIKIFFFSSKKWPILVLSAWKVGGILMWKLYTEKIKGSAATPAHSSSDSHPTSSTLTETFLCWNPSPKPTWCGLKTPWPLWQQELTGAGRTDPESEQFGSRLCPLGWFPPPRSCLQRVFVGRKLFALETRSRMTECSCF